MPPFDHPDIWDGHATLVTELVEQLDGAKPAAVVLSVGGGGLFLGVDRCAGDVVFVRFTQVGEHNGPVLLLGAFFLKKNTKIHLKCAVLDGGGLIDNVCIPRGGSKFLRGAAA